MHGRKRNSQKLTVGKIEGKNSLKDLGLAGGGANIIWIYSK
jgi:hypothetical protein